MISGSCGCGRPSVRKTGECHPCYIRAWKKGRKMAGGPMRSPCVQEWFDWEIVRRAWCREPYNRKLTRAERVHLASLLAQTEWSETEASRLLGMAYKAAAQLVSDVSAGRVSVPVRGWDGAAL